MLLLVDAVRYCFSLSSSSLVSLLSSCPPSRPGLELEYVLGKLGELVLRGRESCRGGTSSSRRRSRRRRRSSSSSRRRDESVRPRQRQHASRNDLPPRLPRHERLEGSRSTLFPLLEAQERRCLGQREASEGSGQDGCDPRPQPRGDPRRKSCEGPVPSSETAALRLQHPPGGDGVGQPQRLQQREGRGGRRLLPGSCREAAPEEAGVVERGPAGRFSRRS